MNYLSEELAPEIGRWHCFCCEHDLYEIKNLEDIQIVLDEREYGNPRVWLSRKDAIEELTADVVDSARIVGKTMSLEDARREVEAAIPSLPIEWPGS